MLLGQRGRNIMGRTICALGDAAAMPVRAMIKHFRHEFGHDIADETAEVVGIRPRSNNHG